MYRRFSKKRVVGRFGRARRGVRAKTVKRWKNKVARVAKSVSLRNQETKRVENAGVASLFQAASATGSVKALAYVNMMAGIGQGTSQSTRIGDRVTLKGINFRFLWNNNAIGSPNNDIIVRMSLFKIKPYLSVPFTRDQFFLDGTLAAAAAPNLFVRGPNEELSIIEKTYFDKIFEYRPMIAGTTHAHHMVVHVPLHNLNFEFENSTLTGSKFDIVMVLQAYVAGAALDDNTGQIQFTTRIYYKDA